MDIKQIEKAAKERYRILVSDYVVSAQRTAFIEGAKWALSQQNRIDGRLLCQTIEKIKNPM